MSIESMAVALHHSRARGTTKLVLLGIANHDGDGGAWPTIATLATYAGGVDERTVRRSIAELVDLGEVVVHVNAGGDRNTRGDHRPNLYEVTLACPEGCDRTKNHRIDGGTPVSARAVDGGTPVSGRGDVGVHDGGTPTSAEPSLNLPMNQGGSRDPIASPPADDDSPPPLRRPRRTTRSPAAPGPP